ncbi:cytochrome c [Azorhizobium caulinodans ORS 571]|uniref:Cytochrome c n=2 Tax=Azorhizobium caulinodans TaxID=7 RepID=A8HUL3_AZOC5|nr:cytochrome c [Azorhizobium caulinodans ORS 571]
MRDGKRRSGWREWHAGAVVAVVMAGLGAPAALAQMALPTQAPLTGAELFKRQCGTCHTTNAADQPRQGPTLAGVFGRKAGSVEGFRYSPGFAKADFSWDEAHLDAWLTNPQAVIPGAIMPYRQPKPDLRAALIGYLKELK